MEKTLIATIGSAFGLQGLVKLYLVDRPEPVLSLRRMYVESIGVVSVQECQQNTNGLVVGFANVRSRDDAEALKGKAVYALDEDLPALDEGVYYYHQLVGLSVHSPTGEPLGKVQEVLDYGAQDILKVRHKLKTYLVPLQAPYVQVRLGEGIVLDAPEGLL